MTTTTTNDAHNHAHDDWLRRLSDYHSDAASGGAAPGEHAAVEAHLPTCDECQRALIAYQRLYALAASPLRLGAPSAAVAQQDRYFVRATSRAAQRRGMTMPPSATPPPFDSSPDEPNETFTDATTRPLPRYTAATPPGGPSRRRPRWGGIAAALVAALLIVAFAAMLAPRLLGPRGSGVPTATVSQTTATPYQKIITTPSATVYVTVEPTVTPPVAPTGFVCADAPGEQGVYAFINTDLQVYTVTNCGAPQKLTNLPPLAAPQGGQQSQLTIQGFSPGNTLLMVSVTTSASAITSCQAILNTQTGELSQTPFCDPPYTANWSQWPFFIGWLDDHTFLESITLSGGHVRIEKVDTSSFAQTTLTTVPFVANLAYRGDDAGIAIRGDAMFYAGYADGSTSQAALRRYSLTDGSDRQIVPLGLAGFGGCQMSSAPCGWTGPWDVTPDGAHVIYHNPGPQLSISDTTNPQDTPLFYANSDGSGAVQLFDALPQQPNGNIVVPTSPVVSPDGSTVVAAYLHGQAPQRVRSLVTPGGGSLSYLPYGDWFDSWRTDSAALLLTLTANYPQPPEYGVYTLATGQVTVLTAGTSNYVWGN